MASLGLEGVTSDVMANFQRVFRDRREKSCGFQWMTKAVDDVLMGLKGEGRQVRHPRVYGTRTWNNKIIPLLLYSS